MSVVSPMFLFPTSTKTSLPPLKAQYGTSASLSSIIAPIDSSSRFSYTVPLRGNTPTANSFRMTSTSSFEVLRLVLEKRLRAIQKVFNLLRVLRVPVQLAHLRVRVPPHVRVDELELVLVVHPQRVVALPAHDVEPPPDLRAQLVLREGVEQAPQSPLETLRVPGVPRRGDDRDVHANLHELQDLIDHLVILLEVLPVRVQRAVRVERHELDVLGARVHLRDVDDVPNLGEVGAHVLRFVNAQNSSYSASALLSGSGWKKYPSLGTWR